GVLAPKVMSVFPRSGPPRSKVTVVGTGFNRVRKVMFGAVTSTFVKVVSPEELKVTVAARASGRVNLRVVTATGVSPATTKARYTVAPTAVVTTPMVSSVSPQAGTPAGGTTVTVTGSGFTKVKKVTFGTAAGSSVNVISASKLQVIAPAHSQATVNVQ